jgi:hypothetical protein
MQSKGRIRVLAIMKTILAICLMASITSCSREDERKVVVQSSVSESEIFSSDACLPPAPTSESTSIESLISNPAQFEGKSVVVTGYYYSRFEHSAIYPSRRDPETSKWDDGLWLYGLSPFLKFYDRSVTVSGIFSSRNKGHLGQWPGSICVSAILPASQD